VARATEESPLDGRAASADELRNLALDICMEWGPELARPEDVRFHERCTGVEPAEATALLAEARAAFSLGCRIVYDDWDESRVHELQATARAAVEAAHPWVDADNMSRILSQAAYDGWHG
jgi:hypothetical protein